MEFEYCPMISTNFGRPMKQMTALLTLVGSDVGRRLLSQPM
jgi:hypothetical protein